MARGESSVRRESRGYDLLSALADVQVVVVEPARSLGAVQNPDNGLAALIEEATVDAYGESDQLGGFHDCGRAWRGAVHGAMLETCG
jgi:hypothetical protein